MARGDVCQMMPPVGLEVNAWAMKSMLLPHRVKKNACSNAKILLDANGSLFIHLNLHNRCASCSVNAQALMKLVKLASVVKDDVKQGSRQQQRQKQLVNPQQVN